MGRAFASSLIVLLTCSCLGCIPVAYVYPDVDVLSADFRDPCVADSPLELPLEEAPEIVVLQDEDCTISTPAIRILVRQEVRQVESDGGKVREVCHGVEAGVGIVAVLGWGVTKTHHSNLQAYRRGYRTVAVLPWKPLSQANWRRAESLSDQEVAIDLLTDCRAELDAPLPAPTAPGEGPSLHTTNLRISELDSATASFIAKEYAWLAEATRCWGAMQNSRGIPTPHLDGIFQRLEYKAAFWQGNTRGLVGPR